MFRRVYRVLKRGGGVRSFYSQNREVSTGNVSPGTEKINFDECIDTYQKVKKYDKTLGIERFSELIKNDKDREKIAEILESYEIVKYESGEVPGTISVRQMKDLMLFTTHREVLREFKAKLANESLRYDRHLKNLKKIKFGPPKNIGISYDPITGAPYYGTWRNSLFLIINEASQKRCCLPDLITSSLFGQKLVLDCAYEKDLTLPEIRKTALNVARGFKIIRSRPEPFDLWLCNYNKDGLLAGYINDALACREHGWSHNTAKESPAEIFDRKKLVYLSRDAPKNLEYFDPETIYIIGALTVMDDHKRLSHIRAKELGLNCLKFPIDEHVKFKGGRTLTIPQTCSLLCHLKENLSWKDSIELAVPKYKLMSEERIEDVQRERQKRLITYKEFIQ